MKTRTGFVSNSSSTSFIIAIRKPQTPVEIVLLEAISVLTKNHKNTYEEHNVKSYKDKLDFERTEIRSDIRFADERIKKLTELSKDKKLVKMMQMAKQFDDNLNYQRTAAESDFKWTPQGDIDHLGVRLKSAATRLTDINEKLSKLEGLDDDDHILIFDKDNWQDDIKNTLKLFEEHGKIIKIIETISN